MLTSNVVTEQAETKYGGADGDRCHASLRERPRSQVALSFSLFNDTAFYAAAAAPSGFTIKRNKWFILYKGVLKGLKRGGFQGAAF